MKKIISLLLITVLCLMCLTACGDNTDTDTDSTSSVKPHSVDVIAQMTEGKLPEAAVALGADVWETRDILNALENLPEDADVGDEYTYYYEFDNGTTVKLDCEGIYYCYNKANSDGGISAIVSFDNAYGFDGTYMMGDITAVINAKATSYSPSADDLFFVLGEPELDEYTAMYYTVGKYRLDFFFYDSFLSATVLQDTTKWNPAE